MFIILEMIENDPQAPILANTKKAADMIFENIITKQKYPVQELVDEDLQHTSAGTIRFAGDELWSLQMWEVF
jgi:hypothetical protein